MLIIKYAITNTNFLMHYVTFANRLMRRVAINAYGCLPVDFIV